MPYIGNTPAEKYAAFDVQYFTTSATTSYTLDNAVANELDIRLVINNVIQEPGSGKAYTASGTTLTLSAATAGTDTMYAVYTGKASQTVNPPAGSVGPSQIANNAVDLTSKVTGTLPIANGGTGSTATTFVNATTNITGVVPAANLGTGTASSSTVLYGDGTFKAEPSGKMVLLQSASTQTNAGSIVFDGVFDKDKYSFYKLIGWFRPATAGTTMQFRWRSSSADLDASTYYGVTHGKAINGGGQADVSWDRWGGNYAKLLADMKNLAYNGATMDMLLRPRFASGTSTQSVASLNFRAGFWDNNSGSERSIVVNGACSYTSTSADMDNGGFVLFQSSGEYDEFEYVLYGVTQS